MPKVLENFNAADTTYTTVPAKKEITIRDLLTHTSGLDYPGIDPDYPLVKKRYFSGGAGLTSTAGDYAIFLQMMLNGGKYNGVRILSPRVVEMMTSGQLFVGRVLWDDVLG